MLGDAARRIDHIGNTSVGGLLAKPIVDILLQVAPNCDVERLKSALFGEGWLLVAEQSEPCWQLDWNKGYTNKGYTPTGFADKVFHLHIRRVGDWDELYFRGYIAGQPEAAADGGL